MKVILAITVFAVTLGGLFVFGDFDTTPSNQTAQILLPTSSQSSLPKATTKKSRTIESVAVSETAVISSLSSPIATPVITPTSTQSISYTATLSPSPRPSITLSPTPSPVKATATPTPTSQSTPPPIEAATLSYQSIEIITAQPLTYPQKSSAEFRIKTTAQANCTVKLTLPSGSISSAKGLEPKIADGDGLITWNWNVSWNTKPGTGSIVVSCARDSYSESKTASMMIIESK